MKLYKMFNYYKNQNKKWVLAIPNLLSIIRIILSIILLALFFVSKKIDIFFIVVFSLGVISDKLDGYIAKKFNAITLCGKLLDPISDKILVATVMIILFKIKLIPLWAIIITMLKDMALSNYRYIKLKRGIVVPALRIGRYKTAYNFFVFEIIFILIFSNGSIYNEKIEFIKYLILTTIL